MIVDKILQLPARIGIERAWQFSYNRDRYIRVAYLSFDLEIFVNGKDDLRLCYALSGGGLWANPYLPHDKDQKGYSCGFLYLCTNIHTDKGLLLAINQTKRFLKKNHLLTQK